MTGMSRAVASSSTSHWLTTTPEARALRSGVTRLIAVTDATAKKPA